MNDNINTGKGIEIIDAPLNLPSLEDTYRLVADKLNGKLDMSGVPLHSHGLRVFRLALFMFPGISFDALHAALLHDIVEDTGVTLTDLSQMGYTERTVNLVFLLTKFHDIPYADYIQNLVESGDIEAIALKLADNTDNTDPIRNALLTPKQQEYLKQRYDGVRGKLFDALVELNNQQVLASIQPAPGSKTNGSGSAGIPS